MKAVTLANQNQNYRLLDLIQGVDAAAPTRLHKMQLQADPVNGGSAKFRIGNYDMDDTNYGVLLYSTQAFVIECSGTNSIAPQEVYLRCDAAGKQFCVVLHTL